MYVSGDLGLRLGLGGKVVPYLTRAGYAVQAINSAVAFHTPLPPQRVAALLAETATAAMAASHATRFVIVGHSFGADILPPAINLLPPAIRSRLSLAVLVVPSRQVYDHVSIAEITGVGKPDRDALSAALAMKDIPRICVSGRTEDDGDSLCPFVASHGYVWSQLPGGHHLDNDPAPLARVLLTTFDRLLPPQQ